MANPQQLFNLLPIWTPANLTQAPFPFALTEYEKKLQADVLNVEEGRVEIDSFDPDRQELIKNYYRFGAHFQVSKYSKPLKRIRSTLELV